MTSALTRRTFLSSLLVVPVAACAPAPVVQPQTAPVIAYRPRTAWEEGVALHLDGYPNQEPFVMSEGDILENAPSERLAYPAPARAAPPRDIDVDPGLAVDQILVFQDRLVIQHIHAPGRAREYAVGLGKAGLEFSGEAIVSRKAEWPSWRPTDAMIARDPERYQPFAGGVPGGPDNPLGARALYLYKDGRDTYYRIHGTDAPHTIGSYVSNGCIRLRNEHIIDLYDRVKIGTVVRVVA